jgi:hypothetical protein
LLNSQIVIGEEPDQDRKKESRIKFLAFCTANIPPEVSIIAVSQGWLYLVSAFQFAFYPSQIIDRFFIPPNRESLLPGNSPVEDISFHVVRSATTP